MSVEETKADDLIDIIRSAIVAGRLRAVDVPNLVDLKAGAVDKIFRLRRADGHEFAIDRKVQSFQIWSSVDPDRAVTLARTKREYGPHKPRTSNISCMERLQGPNRTRLGARAWCLNFNTKSAAFEFISGAV